MKITILGSGAFGLALGQLWHQHSSADVVIWTAFEEEKEQIVNDHCYQKVLPDIMLDETLVVTTDLRAALQDTSCVVVAVPCAAVRSVLKQISSFVSPSCCFLFVCKGLEQNTNKCMSEVYQELGYQNAFGVLAGGTFAKDLITNCPAGLTLATTSPMVRETVTTLFKQSRICIENCTDIVGVEFSSTLKNIFAILMGALTTKYSASSANAYFLTRFFALYQTLLVTFGGEVTTAQTFSGLGDFLLTCQSSNSRNYRFGKLLVQDYQKAMAFATEMTVEGRCALEAILTLCVKKNKTIPLLLFMQDFVLGKQKIEAIFSVL